MDTSHLHRSRADRRGFALPMSLFALVVLAILVTGATFMAHQEGRIGIASEHATKAMYFAEMGMAEAIYNWDVVTNNNLPLWTATTAAVDTTSEAIWSVEVTRMADRTYFLDALATATIGGAVYSGAQHRVGLVAKLTTLDFDPPAALTTRGQTEIKGTAEVHGEDMKPGHWGSLCNKPLKDKPGIVTNDRQQVKTGGAGNVTGKPQRVVEDKSISDSTFTDFGDLDWDDLVAMANIKLPGGSITQTLPSLTGDGRCNTGDLKNWGDPVNPGAPCAGWFPIIHVDGSARIESGGMGQGILLVENDLDLRGNFEFYGIVIVQGAFSTQGSGNRVFGGVMASNANFDSQSLVGGSITTNSTCAIQRAIMNNSGITRPIPLAQRSWVDLSAVME